MSLLLSFHAATGGVKKSATRSPPERQRDATSCWNPMRTLRSRESMRDAKLVRASQLPLLALTNYLHDEERWKLQQQPIALHFWRRSSCWVFSLAQWCGISCRLVSCKLAPSGSQQSSLKPWQAPRDAAAKSRQAQHTAAAQKPIGSKLRRTNAKNQHRRSVTACRL